MLTDCWARWRGSRLTDIVSRNHRAQSGGVHDKTGFRRRPILQKLTLAGRNWPMTIVSVAKKIALA